jgi:hypothetical protein
MQDLRTKRSTDRDQAIAYLLESVSKANSIRGIALVDDRGRMLGGAGSPKGAWAAVRAVQGDWHRRDVTLTFVHADAGEPLRVVALGSVSESVLRRTASGVVRILRS